MGLVNQQISLASRGIQTLPSFLAPVTTAISGMNAASIGATASTLNLSAAQTALLLKCADVSAAEATQALATMGCTKAVVENELAIAGFKTEEIEAAVASTTFAAAEGTATAATATLGTALKGVLAVLAAHPFIAAVIAITALVGVVSSCTTSFNDLKKKAEESRDAFEETQSEIESLNSELETTKNRIDELKAKGGLTLTEASELANLEAQNEKLERQIALKEKLAQIEGQEAADDAAEALEKERTYNRAKYSDYYVYEAQDNKSTGTTLEIAEFYYEKLTDATQKYEAALEECAEAEAEFGRNSSQYKHASSRAEYLKQTKDELESLVATEAESLEALYESIEGYDEYSDIANPIREFLDLYAGVNSAANQAAAAQAKVDELLSRPSLSNAVEAMKELADAKNGLSDDDIEDIIAQFPELDKAARIAGVSIEDIINTINSMAGTINLDEVRKQLTEPNEHGLPS